MQNSKEMSAQSVQGGEQNYLRYNGKELQSFMKVAGRPLEWSDYGARFYEPEIGRWQVIDPMAERYHSFSTYHFSGNNPVRFVDSNGMDYYDYEDYRDEDGNGGEGNENAGYIAYDLDPVIIIGHRNNFVERIEPHWEIDYDLFVDLPTNSGENNQEYNEPDDSWNNGDPQGGGDSGTPVQTVSNVNNYAGIVISAAGEIVQNTQTGANFSYLISGNIRIVNVASKTFEYAPYVGLTVTVLTGTYLSSQNDPATGHPYQSWAETGTDIGAKIGTIYLGGQYGGWVGAGAATLYIADKAAFKWYMNTVSEHPEYVLPSSVYSFTH